MVCAYHRRGTIRHDIYNEDDSLVDFAKCIEL
jgi:hypothetical protein